MLAIVICYKALDLDVKKPYGGGVRVGEIGSSVGKSVYYTKSRGVAGAFVMSVKMRSKHRSLLLEAQRLASLVEERNKKEGEGKA